MPIKVDPSIKPTVVVQPDMRFATTFLSTKFRDHAVPGEAIMDKASGELFLKRPTDGKVISFHQNKKMLHDLVLELRILLTNNENFTYPIDDEASYFISTNYDFIAINNESLYDLITDDVTIPGTPDNINKLEFKVAGKSNGFFCRATTRDCDKPITEYLTNQYDSFYKNYNGLDNEKLAEKKKFDTIEKWKDSNCTITYDVEVHKDDKSKKYENQTDYVRLNESCAVLFDYTIGTDFPNGVDYYIVTIKKFDYYKLHLMAKLKDQFGDEFTANYNKFLFDDKTIQPAEFNVMRFVNTATDVEILGNENIIAFVENPYIYRYMSKMDKLKSNSSVYLTLNRPNEEDWQANTVWAERFRDILEDGVIEDYNTENNLDQLELYYSKSKRGTGYIKFTFTPSDTEDLLITKDGVLKPSKEIQIINDGGITMSKDSSTDFFISKTEIAESAANTDNDSYVIIVDESTRETYKFPDSLKGKVSSFFIDNK